MDRFSLLTDDLLIKILSFVPTKDAVTTSLLSKRWMSLWTLVPRLVVDDYWYEDENDFAREIHWRKLSHFVYGTLLLHKAPVLETFHLSVASERLGFEVDLWVRIAVERFVRDLKIGFNYDHGVIRFPSSLFRCGTLETLELNRVVLLEVPHGVSFPSLRTLRLLSVKYSDKESFCRIISSCPVLEDLTVESCIDDNVGAFTINKPSLCSLTVRNTSLEVPTDRENLFVIHSHSLKLLNIVDHFGEVNVIGNMPELVEANLQTLSRHENVLKSLTYVKRLSLCLDGEYPTGSVFFQLVRLELCMCLENWSNMFVCVLQHSPKLQSLKLMENHGIWEGRKVGWIQPSCVPECLLFHLKTFEWVYYDDFEEEKEVAIYILKNAKRLVTATIEFGSVKLECKKQIYEELEIATRGSRACEITIR